MFYFMSLDFDEATDFKGDDKRVVPFHDHVVRNYANLEIFHAEDSTEEDCLGWITIMEKADSDLREKLKEEKLDLDERKKIAKGVRSGLAYLKTIGIVHHDKKLENFLLLAEEAKICDFGLVKESSGRRSYRQLGYARRGNKYRNRNALCKFIWD